MKFITLMLGGFSPLCTIAMICNIIIPKKRKQKLDNQENVNTQHESDAYTQINFQLQE